MTEGDFEISLVSLPVYVGWRFVGLRWTMMRSVSLDIVILRQSDARASLLGMKCTYEEAMARDTDILSSMNMVPMPLACMHGLTML